ncbi:hypothetical protein [Haloechinothrix halophila]|uniref:hypothetical protein n=1 Tax=Haloechinothrix halophila TaxID=1069073 RepID=UPI0012FA0692|nr:hypothetical protein [Haloechinothrix halophila]
MSHLDHRQPDTASIPHGAPCRRPIHFVGSLPPAVAETDRAAMQWMLDHVGTAELTTLPCDRDSRWIIDWLDGLRERGPMDLVLDGDSSDYTKLPVYRLGRGERLGIGDVTPGRSAEVTAALAARRQLSAAELPPYQVSMPAPLDLALFAFGVPAAVMRRLSPRAAVRAIVSAVRYLPVFNAAVVAEIEHVEHLARTWNEEIVIQLESPAVLVAYDRAPRAAWPVLTRFLAQQAAKVISAALPETQFVLHKWCRGDLGHKPIASLRDLSPMVAFTNALAARLERAGRAVPPVHVALCDGDNPPSLDASDYTPLRRLRHDIAVIAGLVDERHPESSATALELTEQALDRPVAAVAAPCGLGRRTADGAAANAALAWRLTGDEHAPTGRGRTQHRLLPAPHRAR